MQYNRGGGSGDASYSNNNSHYGSNNTRHQLSHQQQQQHHQHNHGSNNHQQSQGQGQGQDVPTYHVTSADVHQHYQQNMGVLRQQAHQQQQQHQQPVDMYPISEVVSVPDSLTSWATGGQIQAVLLKVRLLYFLIPSIILYSRILSYSNILTSSLIQPLQRPALFTTTIASITHHITQHARIQPPYTTYLQPCSHCRVVHRVYDNDR